MSPSSILLLIATTSLLIWLGMLLFWGRFWRADQRLDQQLDQVNQTELPTWPKVCVIVPARNEATMLPLSLRSLLKQDYPGEFTIILVNDHSTDGTADVARETAATAKQAERLQVVEGAPLPPGWSGKLWAVEQGIQASPTSDYLLLTDADIAHTPNNLRQLVTKAEQEKLSLVSLMVLLRCESEWEKFLIPAFVFFFQKLYPFPWVNDPTRKTAAAAGGCSLVKVQSLKKAGGIERVRQALIDDCALAAAIKRPHLEPHRQQRIWLGLTQTTISLRPYPTLDTIWDMVARTAFTQLHYSNLLLFGALLGMTLIYLVPPLATLMGIVLGQWLLALVGLITWGLMSLSYWPTIRLYQLSPMRALTLPAIALMYNLMTFDSALRHWQGKGGSWKGRVYSIPKG